MEDKIINNDNEINLEKIELVFKTTFKKLKKLELFFSRVIYVEPFSILDEEGIIKSMGEILNAADRLENIFYRHLFERDPGENV